MTTTMRCATIAAIVLLGVTSVVAQAWADNAPSSAQGQPGAQPSTPGPVLDSVAVAMMIKSVIVAVQHANATGNYSVLRDLGSPGFRQQFDQARLTAVFANLRSRGIDLSPVLMLLPNLTEQPVMTPEGRLRVVGNFPTRPLQIEYTLLFMQQGQTWHLDGIAIDAVPAADAQASPPAAESAKAAAEAERKPKAAPADKKSKSDGK